jgi:mono/diheme cytochrome c family protein
MMFRQSIILATFATGLFGMAGPALSADAAAGKGIFDGTCSACHEMADWQGKNTAELTAMIHDIVAGKTKHKKALKLSDTEIADVAAFITSGK